MNDYLNILKNDIEKIIDDLISKNLINKSFNKTSISLDFFSKSKKGDLSSNILILLNKSLIDKNFEINKIIVNSFLNLKYINNIEIGNKQFLNFFFDKNYLFEKFKQILKEDKKYGYNKTGKNKKINIEFVSANPTGPIHVAHMRGAVFGDVLGNILQANGYNVTREYYVNDSGSQIEVLGNSLFKRYQQINGIESKINENEYPGDYLLDIAKLIYKQDKNIWLDKKEKERKIYFENFAVNNLISSIKKDLSLIDIKFDNYIHESNIKKNNLISEVIKILENKNLLYEGILDKPKGEDLVDWKPRNQLIFRSSKFFDDSDRALKKENNEWTYFANDAAYHLDKYKRQYFKLINVWGADHIGYIKRMKSIVDQLCDKENYLEINICQIVRLIKNKNILKMSKREGNFITLHNIFKQVGKDSLRYYMVSNKNETPMDFDIDRVIEKNKDNPVFYCQYAFARASSVINLALKNKDFKNFRNSINVFDLKTLTTYEWEILMKLISWPYILHQACILRQPHRIVNYIEDLSSLFHSIWNKGKDDQSLKFLDKTNNIKTITKLIWIESMRTVLKNAFYLIGINSPESM